MVKIKICGITNRIDALEAARLGADMLGFVFYAKSKRRVEPAVVRKIAAALPPSVAKVGVFVDENISEVERIAAEAALDVLQFHGAETPEYCASFKGRFKVMKAFRVKGIKDLESARRYDVDFCMFDSYSEDLKGGTGRTFDWGLFKGLRPAKPFLLSGGLTSANIADAVKTVRPYGVDVSSGVESSPGKKDAGLMKKFIENARREV